MPTAGRTSMLVWMAAVALCLAGWASGPAAGTAAGNGATRGTPTREAAATVWLCRPGLADDPCVSDLTTTLVAPSGATRIERAAPARSPGVDCFYVYPTISGETTINANLAVGFRQEEVAIAQASRFSQVCRVFAPVYRQITLSALDHPARITRADALVAYDSVLAAFRDYLAHYNHGRGIVFIGHSQGAVILIRLLQQEVDARPLLRRRLVSAVLLGGNVTVPAGRDVGGDFAHIPACVTARQTGCVVAYSSFSSKPPPGSEFGRTTSDAGVGILAPHHAAHDLRIMCVNPAAPAGGTGFLDPYLPSLVLAFLPGNRLPPVQTAWVAFPHEYTARCESSGDATWLQVSRVAGASRDPGLMNVQDPLLGLHVLDVNIALGNLVQLVGDEARAYEHA